MFAKKFIIQDQVYAAMEAGVLERTEECMSSEECYDQYEAIRQMNGNTFAAGVSMNEVKFISEVNDVIECWVMMNDQDPVYAEDIINKWTRTAIGAQNKVIKKIVKHISDKAAALTLINNNGQQNPPKSAEKTTKQSIVPTKNVAQVITVYEDGSLESVTRKNYKSSKQVLHNSVQYASMSEAARAHNVTRNHIRNWCDKKLNGWSYA